MAKKAKAKSPKKAKKAPKKAAVRAATMTIEIPVGTAEDPHPPYKIPVPVAPGDPPQWIYCKWQEDKKKYVCE
jgi:hypothetical protein